MDATTRARLAELIADIQRRFGPRALARSHPRALPAPPPAITTGFPDLDTLLGGGLPRGLLTELAGRPTSGARTIALHALAQAQAAGDVGVYVDMAATFDAAYAQACGVALADLLLVRPPYPTDALSVIEALALGGAGVVVVDSLAELARHERPGLSWWTLMRRLRAPLRDTPCVLIALSDSQEREGSLASVQLTVRRVAWLHDGRGVRGFQTSVTVLKSPVVAGAPQTTLSIPLDGTLAGL